MSKKKVQYFLTFSFLKPLEIPDVKLPSGMKLNRNQENKAISIEVYAFGTEKKARQIATERVKKLIAVLSLHVNQNIEAKFQSGYKINPDGTREGFVEISVNAVIVSVDIVGNQLDLTTSIDIGDEKFWRQIGHYQKGTRSSDPIEKYREFYLVIEDEGSFTEEERALRHAVSHPELDHKKSESLVMNILGDPFFDPLNSDHVEIVGQYAKKLEKKAKQILVKKSMRSRRRT